MKNEKLKSWGRFTFTFLIFHFSFLISIGQLAIINDPDGYTNVRKGNVNTSKIVGRLTDDDVFLGDFEDNMEWREVWKDSTLTGYIHNSRFMPIDKLPHISEDKVHRTLNENQLIIRNDSILFQITTAPFNAGQHKIKRNEDGYVETINGKHVWGTDGNLPKKQIASISLKIHDKTIQIPASEYADIFNSGIHSMNIYFNKGRIYLYMPLNSDGAGGYLIVWVIKNGKYLKRYVDTL